MPHRTHDEYPCTPATREQAKDAAWRERATMLRSLILSGSPTDLDVAERLLQTWLAETRPNVIVMRKGRPQ